MLYSSVLRTLRNSIFAWIGIVGGAITLFGNLESLLLLAGWARWLIAHWTDWLRSFWTWVLGWFGVLPDVTLRFDLTFSALLVCIGVGSRFEAIRYGDAVQSLTWASFLRSSTSFVSALLAYVAIVLATPLLVSSAILPPESMIYFVFIAMWGMLFLAVMHWPFAIAYGTASAMEVILVLLFIGARTEMVGAEGHLLRSVFVLGAGGFLALWLAVPNRFHWRLWFMLFGVLILVALNVLANLNLEIRPPN